MTGERKVFKERINNGVSRKMKKTQNETEKRLRFAIAQQQLIELRHKNIKRVEELANQTHNAYNNDEIIISNTNNDNNISIENSNEYGDCSNSGVFSNNRPIMVLKVEHEPDDEFERRQNDIFSELRGRNLTKGVWKNLVNHNE